MPLPGTALAARGHPQTAGLPAWWALLLALGLLLACASAPRLPEPQQSDHLVFWEVRSDAGGGRAWLLGSVHLSREEPDFDPAIDRAFEASDALVLEVDPAETVDPELLLGQVLEMALLPDGLTLADVLSEEAYARLREEFAERGHDLFVFERRKPWLITFLVALDRMAAEGYEAEKGVDFHFQQRAAGRLPIVGLESVGEQFVGLNEMPYPLQERMLVEVLDDDGGATELIFAAWRAGDLDLLEALALPDLEEDPEISLFYDSMYFRRNRVMTQRLAELLSDGGAYFVVVGTGHTVGAFGIPALLAERGFDVRRVPRTP